MKKKKTIALLLSCIMLLSAGMTACGSNNEVSEEEQAAAKAEATLTKEIHMNDYRGGITRTLALKDNILVLVDTMKSNNAVLRENNPESFWTKDGYQDFVTNFMSTKIIDDTKWFNEEEASWEGTYKQICSQPSRFTALSDGTYVLQQNVVVARNEKDDYSITGVQSNKVELINTKLSKKETYKGTGNYRILYDCDKDWCKSYLTLTMENSNSITPFTVEMLEYARIDDNIFAIQTETERILVKLESVASDTDIRERKIKEFYYSRLVSDGVRTTFVPFTPLPVYDSGNSNLYSDANAKINEEMQKYTAVNNKGDCTTRYSKNNSLFLDDYLIAVPQEESDTDCMEKAKEWVFEDKALQQALCYKDGSLVVTTYNKLSEKYERFEYAVSGTDEKITKALEDLVEIQNLVGVVEIKAYTQEELADADMQNRRAELEELGLTPEEIDSILNEGKTEETTAETEPEAETVSEETKPEKSDAENEAETSAETKAENPEAEQETEETAVPETVTEEAEGE